MPYQPPKKTVDETPGECYGTEEVVCPHCKHEHNESWAFHEGEGSGFDVQCEKCEQTFWVEIEYSTSYTAWAYVAEQIDGEPTVAESEAK